MNIKKFFSAKIILISFCLSIISYSQYSYAGIEMHLTPVEGQPQLFNYRINVEDAIGREEVNEIVAYLQANRLQTIYLNGNVTGDVQTLLRAAALSAELREFHFFMSIVSYFYWLFGTPELTGYQVIVRPGIVATRKGGTVEIRRIVTVDNGMRAAAAIPVLLDGVPLSNY